MYEFNFQEDKNFFKTSPTFMALCKKVKADKYLPKCDEKIIDASLNLWAESVLKHNLSALMDRIDPIILIDDNNSNDVKKMFGKIISKDKHSRSDNEFQTLRQQHSVHNVIMLEILRNLDEKDPYTDLKKEFQDYKAELVVNKKIKP